MSKGEQSSFLFILENRSTFEIKFLFFSEVCTIFLTLLVGLVQSALNWVDCFYLPLVYFEKIRVFKAGVFRPEYISMG